MEIGAIVPEPDIPIIDFCKSLLDEEDIIQALDPENLAERFSTYFGLVIPPAKDKIFWINFCEKITLNLPTAAALPGDMRGIHYGVNRNYQIHYKHGEWDGGIKHTLSHEIYEIIIAELQELFPEENILAMKTEARANHFAAAVLMPCDPFFDHCVRFLFDPLLLRDKYLQAYFSILIRMGEVLKKRAKFIGLDYQSKSGLLEDFVVQDRTFTKDLYGKIDFTHLAQGNLTIFNGNPFNNLVLSSFKQMAIVRKFPIHLRDGSTLLCGAYPMVSEVGSIHRILVTGVSEEHIAKLQRAVSLPLGYDDEFEKMFGLIGK